MSIKDSYYDTTIGISQASLAKEVAQKIELISVSTSLCYDESTGAAYITGGEYGSVPAFFHPVIIEKNLGHEKQRLAVLDGRNYVIVERTGQRTYRNPDQFNFLCVRTVLNSIWVGDPVTNPDTGVTALRSIAGVSLPLYSQLISEQLGHALSLDPDTQLRICILSAIFYNSLFYADSPNEIEVDRLSIKIATELRVTRPQVMEILEMADYIADIGSFIELAKQIDPVRLHRLTKATLMTALAGTWFGPDANQTIDSAIEHPPTFMAMLFCGGKSAGFKSTKLMRMLDRNWAKNQVPNFDSRIAALIKAYKSNNSGVHSALSNY